MTRTAVITIAHGRHAHLQNQRRSLQLSSTQADSYYVVAMDDPGPFFEDGHGHPEPTVIDQPGHPLGLPLAAARNAGARAAIADGAELLVFLDVDCLAGPELIEAYAEASARTELAEVILCGPVAYLPPAPPTGYDLAGLSEYAPPHPARPAPAPGAVELEGDPSLFWSLSFAVTAQNWIRIGGFCESYLGYGGEDTDFAYLARERGIGVAWVGGARAYHQCHPTQSPPVDHLDDILRNAELFHSRWGWWPMGGWLDAFAQSGLIRFSRQDARYQRVEGRDGIPDAGLQPPDAGTIG